MRVLACAGLAQLQSYGAQMMMVRALQRMDAERVHALVQENFCADESVCANSDWIVEAIRPTRKDPHGLGHICDTAIRAEYDVLFTVGDIWSLSWCGRVVRERRESGRPVAWLPWFFLDQPWRPEWDGFLSEASVILCPSRFALDAARERYGDKAILCLPELSDAYYPMSTVDRYAFREQNFGGDNPFVVGFVGNAQIRKGVHRALKGFAQFHERCPNSLMMMHTRIQSDTLGDLRDLIAQYGLDPNVVKCTGNTFLTDSQLNEMLNGVDVLLNTSLGEGIGLPILEAQLAGTPVLAPKNSAAHELIAGGRGFGMDCSDDSSTLLPIFKSRYDDSGSLQVAIYFVDLPGVQPSTVADWLELVHDAKEDGSLSVVANTGREFASRYSLTASEFDWAGILRETYDDVVRAAQSNVVAVFSVERDEEYIEYAIRAVYPFVDKIVVLFGAWQNEDVESDNTRDIVEHLYDPDSKIVIEYDCCAGETGVDRGQLAKRTRGFAHCEPGDWYWLIDGDEVYGEESAAAIVQFLKSRAASESAYAVQSFNLWKGFSEYAWREWYARLWRVRSGDMRFTRANEVALDGERILVHQLPIDGVYKTHFGYAKHPNAVKAKIDGYRERHARGDFPAISDGWFERLYEPAMTPDGEWLHPIDGYKGALDDPRHLKPFTGELSSGLAFHPYAFRGVSETVRQRDETDPVWSIAVITYETPIELLHALGESLRRGGFGQNGQTCEVLFIDNGSSGKYRHAENNLDLLKATFKQFADRVAWVQNTDNLLYSAAASQAMSLASGRILMIANPDTEVLSCLHGLEKFAESACQTMQLHGIDIASPVQVHPDGTAHYIGGAFDTSAKTRFVHGGEFPFRPIHVGRGRNVPQMPNAPYRTDWITGSFWMMRREAFLSLGPLDWQQYPHYGSDVDYCLRANRRGMNVSVIPTHVVNHKVGMSSAGFENVFSRGVAA